MSDDTTRFTVQVEDKSKELTSFSRRDVLALTGTSLVAGLAGCPEDSENLETSTITNTSTPSETATVTPAPEAVFEVDDLSPAETTVAQGDSIEVSATISNTGTASDTQDIEFRVDENVLATDSLSLDAGGSASVSATLDTSDLDVGEYTHAVASADDEQTGTLTAENDIFEVSDFEPGDHSMGVWETLDVSATIENTGNVTGEQEIEYRTGDNVVRSTTITLDSEDAETVSFEAVELDDLDLTIGDYDHGVYSEDDEAAGTLTLPEDMHFVNFAVSDPALDDFFLAESGAEETVQVTIENTGTIRAEQTIEYRVEGNTLYTTAATIDSLESTQVSFTVSYDDVLDVTGEEGGFEQSVHSADDAVSGDIILGDPGTYIEWKGFAHWPLDDQADTAVDVLGDGSHDGTLENTADLTWVESDQYVGGVALENTGDGYVETSMLGEWGKSENLEGDFAIAYTIDPDPDASHEDATVIGARGADDPVGGVVVGYSQTWANRAEGVQLDLNAPGSSYDAIAATEDNAIGEGLHRVVINKPAGLDPSDWEIYINGVDTEASVALDENPSSMPDIPVDMRLFDFPTLPDRGALRGVLDDVILFDGTLSEEQIIADLERQPWIDLQPQFAVSNLDPSDISLTESGDEETVRVTIENIGTISGEQTIEYRVEGNTLYTTAATIDSLESTQVSFTVSYDDVLDVTGEDGEFEQSIHSTDDAAFGSILLNDPETYIERKGFTHWPLDDEAETAAEVLGDGTHEGTLENTADLTWVESDQYVGGVALENTGDGYVETSTLGEWGTGENLEGDFAIAYTIDPDPDASHEDATVIGARDVNNEGGIAIGYSQTWAGREEGVQVDLHNNGDDGIAATENNAIGERLHRVVINKPAGLDPSEWEIYINGEDVGAEVAVDQDVSTMADLTVAMRLFDFPTLPDRGTLRGILDDVILFEDTLAVPEIEADLTRQPWSSSIWTMEKHTIASGSNPDAISIADVNSDDAIDVVNGSSGTRGIYWYEQGTDPFTWTEHTIVSSSNVTEVEGSASKDIDGDGIPEVAYCDQGADELGIAVADTSDPTDSWSQIPLDTNAGAVQTAQWIDINRDGNLDLVYAYEGRSSGNGGLYWLEWNGSDPTDTSNWTKHEMVQVEGGWHFGSERQDWSGNGDATDFAFTTKGSTKNSAADGLVGWVEEPSNVTNPWTLHTIDSGLSEGGHVQAMDATGGGNRTDIIARSNANLYIYEYDGSSFTKEAFDDSDTIYNHRPVDLSSATADDLLVANKTAADLRLYIRDPGQNDWQLKDSIPQEKADDELIPYDLTGNGMLDVITTEALAHQVIWGEITNHG